MLATTAMLALATQNVSIPTREIARDINGNAVNMPVVSIGTWISSKGEDPYQIVYDWLKLGGRGIDTALIYHDQAKVKQAIADAGLSRDDVFITSKIPSCSQDEFITRKRVQSDLDALGTTYIDLMLIHEPIGTIQACPDTWQILSNLQKNGTLRAIGVSNFGAGLWTKALQKLCGKNQDECRVVPAVNQIRYNVFHHDETTIGYCKKYNITVQAYSPLGGTHSPRSVFKDKTIAPIAKAHNVSAAQVALRWVVQRGDVLTVLSGNPAHQANDGDLFGFALTADEMKALDGIAGPFDDEVLEGKSDA